MSHSITICETRAERFTTERGTAFTLCDGVLVGKSKQGKGWIPFAIPALDVVRRYISQANSQDVETVKRLVDERLQKLAA